MKVPYALTSIVIFVAVMWMGISLATASDTWHYRMTVVVATPEGIKTGSVVREVIYHGATIGSGGPGVSMEIKGEAIPIDLGKDGILFALLCGAYYGDDYGTDVLFSAFNRAADGKLRPSDIPRSGKKVLSTDTYPMFVRFRDLTDPFSVERVNVVEDARTNKPGLAIDGIPLGKDVTVREVTIEITDAPVTIAIDKLLPWLKELHGGYLNGGFGSRGAPLGLHAGNFERD